MKECELYAPLKECFEKMDYTVRGEVKNCDFVAEKDGHFVAVEMKMAFSLKLVYQGLERRKAADEVYVCIPRPKKGTRQKSWRNMFALLKEIDMGLITVAIDSPLKTVEVVLESGKNKTSERKRESLKKEFEGRFFDLNTGGINKTKLVTAYREKSVKMAALCSLKGELSTKDARELGLGNSEIILLRDNYYGWFERVRRGVYAVNEKGINEAKDKKTERLFEYYTNLFKEMDI